MNFEIDDIMNDTIMGIPRDELEVILSEEDDKSDLCYNRGGINANICKECIKEKRYRYKDNYRL